MSLAEELRFRLAGLFATGNVEICENSRRTTLGPSLSWEIRGSSEKPLLHVYADNCNLTRRVTALAVRSDERLMLAVERFGRSAPERMEIVKLGFPRNPKRISRKEFCERLKRILAEKCPDEFCEKLSIAQDLEHSLSCIYARGTIRKGAVRGAFLAVPPGETQDAIEGSLTHALLWLERLKQSATSSTLSFLRLILPEGKAALLVHQLAALDPRLPLQICELHSSLETVECVEPRQDGNTKSWLVPVRETETLLSRAMRDLGRIVEMAPDAISAHANLRDEEVVLRFRGLPFVRWLDGKIGFGYATNWRELSLWSEPELQRLVVTLRNNRDPTSLRHPLYRALPERWMQAILAKDVSRIDINLNPKYVYEQVIARSRGQHGVIDLLTVTNANRLAIIELKATEDPRLPLQAAEYWDAIQRHHAQGGLVKHGYFPHLQLQNAPPLVYLVAPALHFHPTTDAILRYLSPGIEVTRVGLSEGWRNGLRVTMRQ